MTIQHHISDELLEDYASGSLTEGWSIAVATHLALCPTCRERFQKFESLGGFMLENLPASEDVDDAWNTIQDRLTRAIKTTTVAQQQAPVDMVIIPEPLRSYLGDDLKNLKWRALGRGAYHIIIPTGDGTTKVRLLKIPAGKPVPEHGHSGRELTLVLSGSFTDGEDTFSRGDLEEAYEDLIHQPIATPDQDCICLAVTDAPLRFQSWIVRLFQPILGI
ncbi:ChrR family anti-sigma-E factor [Brucellaceae bacterium C25G]